MPAWNPFVRGAAFTIAASLLALNVTGMFSSLRNPAIFQEQDCYFPNDIRLSEAELRDRLAAPAGDRRAFVTDVTLAINSGIAHYWKDEGRDRYHLRIPPTENYLLSAASYLLPRRFAKYEFQDADRAIERGVGLCSQHAIIEREFLRRRGINARTVGLNGHVLLEANVADSGSPPEWWLLDPDYGVVMPHALEAVERQPEIAMAAYRAAGHEEKEVAHVTNLFATTDNVRVDTAWGRVILERLSYALIWIIPGVLLLMAAGGRVAALLRIGHRPAAQTESLPRCAA